jgi:LysM repeat protein
LGAHSKPSRYRISRRLSAAAAPVLAGVAAVVVISPPAIASPTIPSATAQRTIVTDVLSRVGQTPQLLSASHVAGQATTYKVRSGDTLSTIAKHVYNDQAAWPVIYYANRKQVPYANSITAGQVLKIPAKPAHLPEAPSSLGSVAVASTASSASSGSGSGSTVADSTYSGGGGFASCVIARESGGNSQVMNSSGHYGLYQFSESTWEAYGGSAADFGSASVAEQNAVFDTALAQGGQSNWSAYDGC